MHEKHTHKNKHTHARTYRSGTQDNHTRIHFNGLIASDPGPQLINICMPLDLFLNASTDTFSNTLFLFASHVIMDQVMSGEMEVNDSSSEQYETASYRHEACCLAQFTVYILQFANMNNNNNTLPKTAASEIHFRYRHNENDNMKKQKLRMGRINDETK